MSAFTRPTWPSDDDLTSDPIPTLAPSYATTGPMLRVGIRRGSAVTLNAPASITALDADGVDALVAVLQRARNITARQARTEPTPEPWWEGNLAAYIDNDDTPELIDSESVPGTARAAQAELKRLRAIERAARAVADNVVTADPGAARSMVELGHALGGA